MPDTRCGVLGTYPCYQGIATTAGGTLVLFKAPPEVTDTPSRTTLAAERDAARMDLSALFAASDGGALTYIVGSSDPMLATATVDGTTLTLASSEDGREGAVTITVTDEDGLSVTVTFEVSIEAIRAACFVAGAGYCWSRLRTQRRRGGATACRVRTERERRGFPA